MWLVKSLLQFPPKSPRPQPGLSLRGERVVLRAGDPADWRQWRTVRGMSHDFLKPWEPSWPDNALEYGFFCGLLRRHWLDWRQGRGYSFLIFNPALNGATGALLGGIALNTVERGVAQKASLGYWMGQPHAGQGLMTEAAALVCAFAFETLRLHRVEASCLPHNEPSKHLLTKLGFVEEGYARSYLQIDGRWQDHLLWGLSTSDWRG